MADTDTPLSVCFVLLPPLLLVFFVLTSLSSSVRTVVEVTSTVSLSVSVRVWVCVTSDATSHVSVVVLVAMQLVLTVTGSRTVEVRTEIGSGGSGSGGCGGGKAAVELAADGYVEELSAVVVVVDEATVRVVNVPIVPDGSGLDVPVGRGNEDGGGDVNVPVPMPLPLAKGTADEFDRVKVGQVRLVHDERMPPVLTGPTVTVPEVEFERGKGTKEVTAVDAGTVPPVPVAVGA